MADPVVTAASNKRPLACVRCTQRKVKCDRNNPCAGCTKSGVDCVQSTPVPYKRRKRSPDLNKGDGDSGLQDPRVARAAYNRDRITTEDAIKRHFRPTLNGTGTMVASDDESTINGEKLVGLDAITDSFKKKYLLPNVWSGLDDDFPDPRDLPYKSEENPPIEDAVIPDMCGILLGDSNKSFDVWQHHPDASRAWALWQKYLDNVNVLTKIIHVPTLQAKVLQVTREQDHSGVTKEFTALLFCIYASAVSSMQDEDSIAILGEPRLSALKKYIFYAQHALTQAQLLRTSSQEVLQAFVIMMLALRAFYPAHTRWLLSGVALRIGQAIDLFSENPNAKFTIFEKEMRRRLGWQVVNMDATNGQASGTQGMLAADFRPPRRPANLNDADLDPNMTELPPERVGITEMSPCLIRYEFGDWLSNPERPLRKLGIPKVPMKEKDKAIDDFQEHIETTFIRYCDPSIPEQLLMIGMGRSAMSKLRLLSHHPRHYADKGASLPQEERDMLFQASIKLVEFDTLARTTRSLRRFLWHIAAFFQIDAFVFMLNELRRKATGGLSERAWDQVPEIFHSHPEIFRDKDHNVLFAAVIKLTFNVWEVRRRELKKQLQCEPPVPQFITDLGWQPQTKEAPPAPAEPIVPSDQHPKDVGHSPKMNPQTLTANFYDGSYLPPTPVSEQLSGAMQFDFNAEEEFSPVDWDYWNELISAYDFN